MTRYMLLNLAVLIPLFALAYWKYRSLFSRHWLYALGILIILTTIFDSLIIEAGIVAYNQVHYLGVAIGSAPIEDFAYTLGAMILVPMLWRLFGVKK